MDINTNNVQYVITRDDLMEFAKELIKGASSMQHAVPAVKKEEEPIYTAGEFARKYGVNLSTLWRWRKAGIITPIHIGGRVYYRDSDVSKEMR